MMVKTDKESELLEALVMHFRSQREPLWRQWVRQMRATGVLQNLSRQGFEDETRALYTTFVDGLEPRNHRRTAAYARSIAQQASGAGIPPERLTDSLLTLRDVQRRSLVRKFRADARRLAKALDVYSSAADRLLVLVIRDLFEVKEAAATRDVEQFRALVKTGMILSAKLSLEAVLQRIANMACKVVGARYGALGVLDGKGGLSQFITAGIDEKTKSAIGPLPVGKGILGVLVREAKPLRLTDFTMDPRAHGFPPNHPPMKSFLGVPIVSKGKVFGNLYLTEKRGAEEFSKNDENIAMTLAAQAAIAIENASLYEELHRSYQELRRSQDLLLRQEKLASLGRLAAGLAHELNNPLNHIGGFVEALQLRAEAETLQARKEFEDFPRFLGMIRGQVDRAASIIRRLLDFARQREPSFELLDLGGLISESVSFVERQAAVANKRIVVRPLPEPVQLRADAQMLQQLLLNLLTNALDAIEGDGEVRIAADLVKAGHGARDRREIVELSVADDGCGIALEHLSKVFDPFFTTKEVGKGTGLGLPICQSIVEQHGGTIEIKSEGLGKGALVTVKLPVQR
jgi:signal transduction histidine kinase